MSRFDPTFYRRFRPFYPSEAFHLFSQGLISRGFQEPFQIADIGCGTGHSATSLLHTGIQAKVIGIDPDPGMLGQAKLLTRKFGYEIELKEGIGEKTGINSNSVDAALIGSAFHWMDPEKTKLELLRVLKARGLIRIMEYQFPKAINHPSLNEWIRRQFNLLWKAPGQKPRGTFTELMNVFKSDPRLIETGSSTPPMIQSLTASELFGLLWSQSRVLCYLNTLSNLEKELYQNDIQNKLEAEFGGGQLSFDFKLQWIEFGLKS